MEYCPVCWWFNHIGGLAVRKLQVERQTLSATSKRISVLPNDIVWQARASFKFVWRVSTGTWQQAMKMSARFPISSYIVTSALWTSLPGGTENLPGMVSFSEMCVPRYGHQIQLVPIVQSNWAACGCRKPGDDAQSSGVYTASAQLSVDWSMSRANDQYSSDNISWSRIGLATGFHYL